MSLQTDLLEAYKGKELDGVKQICKAVNHTLKDQFDMVALIGGRKEGLGKSTLGTLLGILGDPGWTFEKNMIFAGNSEELIDTVYDLPHGSYLVYDEAIQMFDKADWMTNASKMIKKMFVRCRKQYKVHLLCMPDITDSLKMLRTRRIRWWFEIIERGHCIVLRSDRLPGNRDPWHLESWNKYVNKKRGSSGYAYETTEDIADHLRAHPGFFSEFKFPKLPRNIEKRYLDIADQWAKVGLEEEAPLESDPIRRIKLAIPYLYMSGVKKQVIADAFHYSVRSVNDALRKKEKGRLSSTDINTKKEKIFSKI